jgi:hypothetical protein
MAAWSGRLFEKRQKMSLGRITPILRVFDEKAASGFYQLTKSSFLVFDGAKPPR